jgi:hypothetical protein
MVNGSLEAEMGPTEISEDMPAVTKVEVPVVGALVSYRKCPENSWPPKKSAASGKFTELALIVPEKSIRTNEATEIAGSSASRPRKNVADKRRTKEMQTIGVEAIAWKFVIFDIAMPFVSCEL